jgi:hypothetical protein
MSVVINGSAGVTTNSGAVYDGIQRGTAITLTNQTAPEFTSIPSWTKRITVIFQSVSTNGSGDVLIQLGTSGGFVTSGYLGASASIASGAAGSNNYTTGIAIRAGGASVGNASRHGAIVITQLSGNNWVAQGCIGYSDAATAVYTGASIALSGTLDRLRLFIDGTQQFDAGTINILYE